MQRNSLSGTQREGKGGRSSEREEQWWNVSRDGKEARTTQHDTHNRSHTANCRSDIRNQAQECREEGREGQATVTRSIYIPGIEGLEALAIEADDGGLVGEFDSRVDVLGRGGSHGGVRHGCLPALHCTACLACVV
jgi:hypothetical protein